MKSVREVLAEHGIDPKSRVDRSEIVSHAPSAPSATATEAVRGSTMTPQEMEILALGAHAMGELPADEPLAPSPARDVPRVDPITADVERLALFLHTHSLYEADFLQMDEWRSIARRLVRDFDQLEEILAEILERGGRF